MTTTNHKDEPRVQQYISEHFLLADCICPCCDRVKVVPGLFRHLGLLERLYAAFGERFYITSGHRCPAHNREIGGSPRSWHLLFATDIQPATVTEESIERLYRLGIEAGFGGVGRYDRHVHLDLRPEPMRWRV